MNNTTAESNFFFRLKKFFVERIKFIAIISVLIFLFFLSFQIFSYYKINKVQKSSINFFNAKDSDNKEDFYDLMKELSDNNDFYSVIANLELINVNLLNSDYKIALELYKKVLSTKNLEPVYISAIATSAAYNFIDIQYKNQSLNFLSEIEYFINNINDNLKSYIDFKLELKYLLMIAKKDINNLSYSNVSEAIDLHKQIMESEDISSTIKERVNKIHEFQLYN